MRRCGVAVLAATLGLLATGCAYTTTAVAPQDLRDTPAAAASDGGSLRLRSTDDRPVTVTRRSELRLVRTDGTTSPWFGARRLFLTDEGVVAWQHVPLALASGARVTGLAPTVEALLAQTAPEGSSPRAAAPGVLQLDASGEVLVAWLDRFVLAVAREEASEEMLAPPPWCYGFRPRGGPDCGFEASDRDRRALRTLGHGGRVRPLGAWSFEVGSQTLGPLDGDALLTARSAGVRAVEGLRWGDLAAIEVKNVSAGKTAANVALQVTVPVLLAAVAAPIAVVGSAGKAMGDGAPKGSGLSGVHAAVEVGAPDGAGAAPANETGRMWWNLGAGPPSTAGVRPILAARR